jgi:3-oxoacyl-[acyl-carrier-protein] synthase-3
MIESGRARTVLAIGADLLTRYLDEDDPGSAMLFGDGAGAVVLQAKDVTNDGPGILSTHLHSDGAFAEILYVDGAVGRRDRPGHLVMNGREVFRQAVTLLASAVNEALEANDLTPEDIDWLVPHQANRRIIDGVSKKLGLPAERVVLTVDKHANTSAASIPLALWQAVSDGRIKPGQLVLLEALGGGLTWGSALLRL